MIGGGSRDPRAIMGNWLQNAYRWMEESLLRNLACDVKQVLEFLVMRLHCAITKIVVLSGGPGPNDENILQ